MTKPQSSKLEGVPASRKKRRARRARGEGHETAHVILKRLLQQKITITESGQTRGVTVLHAILLQVLKEALAGNKRATSVWSKYRKLIAIEQAPTVRMQLIDFAEDQRHG